MDKQVPEQDWRRQPLTWKLLRSRFVPWFARSRRALLAAAVVTLTVGIAGHIMATRGDMPLPAGAVPVQVSEYSVGYDVFRDGPRLILRRQRDWLFGIELLCFICVYLVTKLAMEYQDDRKNGFKGFSRLGYLLLAVFYFGLLGSVVYMHVMPTAYILVHPQTLTLDPDQDQILVNGQWLGKLSEVKEFDSFEEKHRGYRFSYTWSWFGVKLYDGRYYGFDGGVSVVGNFRLLAAYLNGYLKTARKSLPQP